MEPAPILLFDGVCNLCNGSVQWVIRHDPQAQFRFASLQSTAGAALLARHGLPTDALESVVNLARRRRTGAGAALGGIRIGQGLGPALAPVAAGFLFDASGPTVAYLAMALLLGVAALLVFAATSANVPSDESPAS